MKHFIFVFSIIMAGSLVLGACSPGSVTASPAPTEPPSTQVATEAPAATEVSAAHTPTLAPVDLAGPPMQVGSFYTYVDGAILAAVPGGPFIMGYTVFDNPEREVTVDDFWIYTSEVTNQQYALCIAAGKCTPPDPKDNPDFEDYRFVGFPVVGVNYQQSVDYCTFVHARLPTDAEWEKAARGEHGNIFPWGNAAAKCDLLNFNFCKSKTVNVKSYPDGVSYYGLFDMSGNVREWVGDWYLADWYKDPNSSKNPLGPELGEKRSVRSSAFEDSADFAVAAHRFSLKPDGHEPDLGFRCVVTDINYYAPYCQGLTLYGSDVNGNPTDDVIPVPDNCVQPFFTTKTDCPKTSDTYVTINPNPLPQGASANMPNVCSGGPPTYQCSGTDQATIDPETCVVPPPPGGGSCSPGYQEAADPNDPNKKICKGQGPGQQCQPGFNYDPVLQCCSAVNPGPNQYGICGPGFYQQGNVCIPSKNNPPMLVQAVVSWQPVTCDHTGGGCDPATDPTCQPGGCSPSNPVTCTGLKKPSADGCSCVCPPGSTACH